MNLNNNIEADSLNELTIKSVQEILKNGIYQQTRNGAARALYDVNIRLSNPRARHLALKGRTNNIFATLGEIFWVMAGEDIIDPYLSFFIPRAKNYSDDGRKWYSSYGQRLWDYGQFNHIFSLFKDEGLFTRRATQSIFIPSSDVVGVYKTRTGGSVKDIACNQWINYFVIPGENGENPKLCMKVGTRSNDCIFGLSNINIPEFTIIMEFVYNQLKLMYPESNLELGTYIQSVTNLHLYDFTLTQGENIVKNLDENLKLTQESKNDNAESYFPNDVLNVRRFFKDIVENFSNMIKRKTNEIKKTEDIFNEYMVQTNNNLLFGYALLVEKYISNSLGLYDITQLPTNLPKGLRNSVKNSKFLNFNFE